jgi:2-polyprenyl-6-methoxyphenol hydroxylase-like FAD-dependent oxidoreductase
MISPELAVPGRRLRIAIVGAGSAGLLLAVLLQQQGHAVTVFEKAERIRTDGCGILLVQAGCAAIAAAGLDGLLEELLAAGLPVRRFVVRNLRGDQIEASPVERSHDELPSLLIPRPAIVEALARRLEAGSLHRGSELLHWQRREHDTADGTPDGTADDTSAAVEARFADGRLWRGDLVVGADGLFSRVAPLLVPERRLHYLGDRVWRGVVEDGSFCRDGDFFVYARGRGVYANVFDLGEDGAGRPLTHWGLFQEEPLPESRDEQRRLLQEPLPEGALAKLPADLAELMRRTPAERIVANWSFDIDPLARITGPGLALIGDAAHAMSSSQARGMTAGLEDAVALAAALEREPSLAAGLAAYGSERLPVVHRYQERSRAVSARTGRQRQPVQPAQASPSMVR